MRNPRIAGGDIANPKQVPWQLLLELRSGEYQCGAGLTTNTKGEQIVLTTAYCLETRAGVQFPPYMIIVVAGVLNRTEDLCFRQKREVVHIERHPDWPRVDLAMMWLDEPFFVNDYVAPLRLPPRKNFYPDRKAPLHTAGWGAYRKKMDNERSDVLRLKPIPTVTLSDCKKAHRNGITGDNICGWDRASGGYLGPCFGDWGSPGFLML